MGLLEVLTRVRRLDDGLKEITIEDNSTESTIIIDDELSAVSENPVQNKVITNAITEQNTRIVTLDADLINQGARLETQISNKLDKNNLIRKIHIGNTENPPSNLGNDGDLYIYSPYI